MGEASGNGNGVLVKACAWDSLSEFSERTTEKYRITHARTCASGGKMGGENVRVWPTPAFRGASHDADQC